TATGPPSAPSILLRGLVLLARLVVLARLEVPALLSDRSDPVVPVLQLHQASLEDLVVRDRPEVLAIPLVRWLRPLLAYPALPLKSNWDLHPALDRQRSSEQ